MSPVETRGTATRGTATQEESRRRILHRLRRARGQLDAVIRAVESDAACRDVITQLSAVTHALNRAGYTIVATAMSECLADEVTAQGADQAGPGRAGPAETPSAAGGGSTPAERERLTRAELEKIFLTLA